jgi:hypothetical protein
MDEKRTSIALPGEIRLGGFAEVCYGPAIADSWWEADFALTLFDHPDTSVGELHRSKPSCSLTPNLLGLFVGEEQSSQVCLFPLISTPRHMN